MQAVILAAGLGTRLKHVTQDVPKPLVPLNGKPMIGHTLGTLLAFDHIEKIIIVTGHKSQQLEGYISSTFHAAGERIALRHNQWFDRGSILTIRTAAPLVEDTLMIMNADHIYPPPLLAKLMATSREVMIGCDRDRALTNDDMKVLLEVGRLVDISKALPTYDAGYIGLTVVDRSLIPEYFSSVESVLEQEGDGAVVERVLLNLARRGLQPHECDLSGFGWFEVDTPEDLAVATEGLKGWKSAS